MAGERGARKRQRAFHDDDDGKKARGRPRVEGGDETAVDVCAFLCHVLCLTANRIC